jgi:hypothetical protein
MSLIGNTIKTHSNQNVGVVVEQVERKLTDRYLASIGLNGNGYIAYALRYVVNGENRWTTVVGMNDLWVNAYYTVK